MTSAVFWRIVDKAARAREPGEALRKALQRLTAEEIAGFDRQFQAHVERAYRWDLWGAAYLRNGGCAKDTFVFFLYDLIALGKVAYTRALANADSIANTNVSQNEEYGTIAHEVYDGKTGGEQLPLPKLGRKTPAGKRWNFDDPVANAKHLPHMHAEAAIPRAEELFQQGYKLAESGKYRDGNKCFRESIAVLGGIKNPSVPIAHGNLMRGEYHLGNLAAARKEMNLAFETLDQLWRQHRDHRAWLCNEAAWFLLEHGSKAELTRALAYARRGQQAKDAMPAMDTEMRILLRMGREDDAREVAKRALRINRRHRDFQDVKKRWKL